MDSREVLRQRLGQLSGEIRHVRQRFIDGLTFKQYNKWTALTRKAQRQHGSGWLLFNIDLSKVTKAAKHQIRLAHWCQLVDEYNIMQRRYDFYIVAA